MARRVDRVVREWSEWTESGGSAAVQAREVAMGMRASVLARPLVSEPHLPIFTSAFSHPPSRPPFTPITRLLCACTASVRVDAVRGSIRVMPWQLSSGGLLPLSRRQTSMLNMSPTT